MAVGCSTDHLEPPVGIGDVQERPVRQPAGARCPGCRSPAITSVRPVARSTRTICEVSGSVPGSLAMIARRAPSGDHSNDSTSTPVSVTTDGSGNLRLVGRPTAARDRRVDDPDLRPAATPRDEGEAATVGRPVRQAGATGLAGDPGRSGAVRLHDPQFLVADVGRADGRRATRRARRSPSPTRSPGSASRPGAGGRTAVARPRPRRCRPRRDRAGGGGTREANSTATMASIVRPVVAALDDPGISPARSANPLSHTTCRAWRCACGRGRGGSRRPSSSRRASEAPRCRSSRRPRAVHAAPARSGRASPPGCRRGERSTIRSFQASMPSSGSASHAPSARKTSMARAPSSAQSARWATWSRAVQPGVTSPAVQRSSGSIARSASRSAAAAASPAANAAWSAARGSPQTGRPRPGGPATGRPMAR